MEPTIPKQLSNKSALMSSGIALPTCPINDAQSMGSSKKTSLATSVQEAPTQKRGILKSASLSSSQRKPSSPTSVNGINLAWDNSAVKGQHIWLDTNSSRSNCYLMGSECTKNGVKKKCAICKVVVHSGCLGLLKFECRLTFRESMRDVNQEEETCKTNIEQPHHWVRRRYVRGKCSTCSRSFQNKFQFAINEAVAVQCSWCKEAYHIQEPCYTTAVEIRPCTLGKLSKFIVPPHWIVKILTEDLSKPVSYAPLASKDVSGKWCSQILQTGRPTRSSLPTESPSLDMGGSSSCVGVRHRPFRLNIDTSASVRPVLVFVNSKSGGKQGLKLLKRFYWLLNPRQVFEISESGPIQGLQLFGCVPNLRILVCGGDGTVSWIMSEMDSLQLQFLPLAVLPLGTGNDLARTTNWGASYNDESLSHTLSCVMEGSVVAIDRWNLSTRPYRIPTSQSNADIITAAISSFIDEPSPKQQHFERTPQPQPESGTSLTDISNGEGIDPSVLAGTSEVGTDSNLAVDQHLVVDQLPLTAFNNYFSLGTDAASALGFHETRETNPEKFNSRIRNMLFYAGLGGKDLFKRNWRDLTDYISLTCDGVDYTERLRELRSHALLFLNIPRYSAGSLPWGKPGDDATWKPQRIDDSLLEVIGLSSTSLATLNVGGHGDRVCQCRLAVLTTTRVLPVQVDGEPCRLGPSIIEMSPRNQANMILKPKTLTCRRKPLKRILCCFRKEASPLREVLESGNTSGNSSSTSKSGVKEVGHFSPATLGETSASPMKSCESGSGISDSEEAMAMSNSPNVGLGMMKIKCPQQQQTSFNPERTPIDCHASTVPQMKSRQVVLRFLSWNYVFAKNSDSFGTDLQKEASESEPNAELWVHCTDSLAQVRRHINELVASPGLTYRGQQQHFLNWVFLNSSANGLYQKIDPGDEGNYQAYNVSSDVLYLLQLHPTTAPHQQVGARST